MRLFVFFLLFSFSLAANAGFSAWFCDSGGPLMPSRDLACNAVGGINFKKRNSSVHRCYYPDPLNPAGPGAWKCNYIHVRSLSSSAFGDQCFEFCKTETMTNTGFFTRSDARRCLQQCNDLDPDSPDKGGPYCAGSFCADPRNPPDDCEQWGEFPPEPHCENNGGGGNGGGGSNPDPGGGDGSSGGGDGGTGGGGGNNGGGDNGGPTPIDPTGGGGGGGGDGEGNTPEDPPTCTDFKKEGFLCDDDYPPLDGCFTSLNIACDRPTPCNFGDCTVDVCIDYQSCYDYFYSKNNCQPNYKITFSYNSANPKGSTFSCTPPDDEPGDPNDPEDPNNPEDPTDPTDPEEPSDDPIVKAIYDSTNQLNSNQDTRNDRLRDSIYDAINQLNSNQDFRKNQLYSKLDSIDKELKKGTNVNVNVDTANNKKLDAINENIKKTNEHIKKLSGEGEFNPSGVTDALNNALNKFDSDVLQQRDGDSKSTSSSQFLGGFNPNDPNGVNPSKGFGDAFDSTFSNMGSCSSSITFEISQNKQVNITCADTADLRAVLSWIFALMTLLYVFSLILETRPEV